MAKSIQQVPPAFDDITQPEDPRNWNPRISSSDDGYEPCAELSWVKLTTIEPTPTSPQQVMLFHRGNFVMTATATPVRLVHSVDKIADGEVRIGFAYRTPGEGPADATGKTVVTYTWDESRGSIVRSGDLPADLERKAPQEPAPGETNPNPPPPPPPPPGRTCADNFTLPDGVDKRVCGAAPSGARQLSTGAYGAALIMTPSKNIWCSLRQELVDCSVMSSRARIDLGTSGKAYKPNRDDGPASATPVTVNYGQSVTLGPFACLSQEIGLSCWNTKTQHGLFLSRESSLSW